MAEKESKTRVVIFSAAEQKMLMELYDEFKSVITRKGNTAAINKARETAANNCRQTKCISWNMQGIKQGIKQEKT